MPYSAHRMLASKIAYSARNSAGRIYPSLPENRFHVQHKLTKGHVRESTLLTITKKKDGLRNGILQTFRNTVNSLVSNHRWCKTKW